LGLRHREPTPCGICVSSVVPRMRLRTDRRSPFPKGLDLLVRVPAQASLLSSAVTVHSPTVPSLSASTMSCSVTVTVTLPCSLLT